MGWYGGVVGLGALANWGSCEGGQSDVLLVGVNWNAQMEGDEIEPLDLLEEFDEG